MNPKTHTIDQVHYDSITDSMNKYGTGFHCKICTGWFRQLDPVNVSICPNCLDILEKETKDIWDVW
jgi:hypothetical protein